MARVMQQYFANKVMFRRLYVVHTLKELVKLTNTLVILSSKTYVFEDELTTY